MTKRRVIKMQVIEVSYDENYTEMEESVVEEVEVDLGYNCEYCAEELKNLEEKFLKAGAPIPKYERDNKDIRARVDAEKNRGLVMFFNPSYNVSGYSGAFHVEVLQQSEYTILTEKKGEKK